MLTQSEWQRNGLREDTENKPGWQGKGRGGREAQEAGDPEAPRVFEPTGCLPRALKVEGISNSVQPGKGHSQKLGKPIRATGKQ